MEVAARAAKRAGSSSGGAVRCGVGLKGAVAAGGFAAGWALEVFSVDLPVIVYKWLASASSNLTALEHLVLPSQSTNLNPIASPI